MKRNMLVSDHETFWLEPIRAASRDSDPTPTLWRTQQLTWLFCADGRTNGGLAALLPQPSEAYELRPIPLEPYGNKSSSKKWDATNHMFERSCADG